MQKNLKGSAVNQGSKSRGTNSRDYWTPEGETDIEVT